MEISFDLINGVALGIEYVQAFDDEPNTVILDVLIFRFLFQWE
jgi:hypothetical protein